MSIFEEEHAEVVLGQVLLAFMQEWGPEYVSVCVPMGWSEFGIDRLGGIVPINFHSNEVVSINVDCAAVHLRFAVRVRTRKVQY
jgi:hypothetical protein